MFANGAGFWTLAGSVTQPIFQGGALLHKERAARAAYVQAAEQYRSTVLTAFQNVADTLNALEQDANALKATAAAKDAAGITLDLARKQWQSGYANYLALLSAENDLSAKHDHPRAGPGQSLCRHRRALSGARRWLVAPRRSYQELTGKAGPGGARMTAEAESEKRRVFIVDDHPLVREWLTSLINQQPDLTVCGEAAAAAEAMQAVAVSKPEVAIVDISLKDSSGIELIKDLKHS